MDDLEALAPERGFWTGDVPSVADVALYGQLQSFRVDITPWQRELLESFPRLTTYLERVAGAKPVDFSRVAA